MLALPIKVGVIGFGPFLLMFVLSWFFMMYTGLLLLEVTLCFKGQVSLISMADRTLGKFGKILSWVFFCFLFYTLMVAYIAGSTSIFTAAIKNSLGISLSNTIVTIFATLFFGGVIYLGARIVDRCNRVLMLGLVLTYAVLIVLGGKHNDMQNLTYSSWGASFFTLPVMIVMFGYHNLIPTLSQYLAHDESRLRKTIIFGTIVSFLICFAWVWMILGIVPASGENGLLAAAGDGLIATQALERVVGYSWVSHIAQAFAFFAIATSCIGVALSFVDFLSDGLKISKSTVKGRFFLCLLVMLPAFLMALSSPKIFFTALDYAGGFAAVILFGVFPVAMVWVVRYRQKRTHTPIAPGGKVMLLAILAFAMLVFSMEYMQEMGLGPVSEKDPSPVFLEGDR